MASNWIPQDDPDKGLMYILSQAIEDRESRDSQLLPDLRLGHSIFIASDYSGHAKSSDYETLAFLFTDLGRCGEWQIQRKEIRERFLHHGRRMSFKGLNDNLKRQALGPFLRAANTMPGLLLTILIDKTIRSLSHEHAKLDLNQPGLQQYRHWDLTTLERLFRISHIMGIFVAGLSRRNQDIIWVTDEDAILPNPARRKEAQQILRESMLSYLKHELRHFNFTTTKDDNATRVLEDLAAIPDLAAGALSEVVTAQKKQGLLPTTGFTTGPPANLSWKSSAIMDWFSGRSHPLRRLVFAIYETGSPLGRRIKWIQYNAR